MFQQIDTNNDGCLTVDEIEKALKKQGVIINSKELHAVLKSVDMDKNGKINFNEFIASMLED
ncbi:MAG: EF-hand domain-containing protein [Leptospira sp.]|nr:EF-hand domain-containing protein [Leptospira sp.]